MALQLNDSTRPLQLLHSIVKCYEREAAAFFGSADQSVSRFSGRFNFRQFACTMFDEIDAKELSVLYVEMLRISEDYMHNHRKSTFGVPGHPHSYVSVPELLINMILAYQLPQQRTVPVEKEEEKESEEGTSESSTDLRKKRKAKKGKTVMVNPRVTLTTEASLLLLEQMLMVPLPYESKIWKQAKYVLCPSSDVKKLAQFGVVAARKAQEGMISYSALNFFMHDEILNKKFENPLTILQALYMGPLSAHTVEIFAANRSDEFRENCRTVLRIAIEASMNPQAHALREPSNIPPEHPNRSSFRVFVENVSKLIQDLKGESTDKTGLHAGWACAAIKKFGHKRYIDKTWKDENYYDLIWTVLAQRPNLKKFVIDVLEKKFNDYDAARFWRRMQPHQMFKNIIRNTNVITEDPLKPTEEFLNFPPNVRDIKMISTEREVQDFGNMLSSKVRHESMVYVGVDAEWSAYVSPSKATILQMALYDVVYIMDLESAQISPETYRNFLSYFFLEPKILKIGFSFGEDLHQLRAGFRNCVALYRPQRVICVMKIVTDLIDEINKKENAEDIKREFLPFLVEDNSFKEGGADTSMISEDGNSAGDRTMDSKLNESMDEESATTTSATDDVKSIIEPVSAKSQFMNKGLSYFCEKILGKPLDKTEQCSVWDRRPLRNLQLRYAAMDAYCMLMLYDKSKNIFASLGQNIDEFVAKQSDIKISLPLLSESRL